MTQEKPDNEEVAFGSPSQGYALLSAMENFAVEAMRLDEFWKPIWKIAADDPDRKEKILSKKRMENFFRFLVAGDDLKKELESSRKWFLETGLQDAGKSVIDGIRANANELTSLIFYCYPLVDTMTTKEQVEDILSHSLCYVRSFDELTKSLSE